MAVVLCTDGWVHASYQHELYHSYNSVVLLGVLCMECQDGASAC